MDFNYIDALLVLIILVYGAFGWYRGFILGLLDLIRWIGSFAAALYFYQPLANAISRVIGWEEIWSQPLAFILIVVFAGFLIQYFGILLLKRLSPGFHERSFNRVLGVLPGLASGAIFAAILSALLFSLPIPDGGFQTNLRESPTANRLAVYTDELEAALSPIFEEAAKRTLNRRITIQPGSSESVNLPFKTEGFRPRPDLEARMLDLVNQERTSRGLSPLEADPELTEVARRHSADMFKRGYFSHYTPEGRDPFDRMREANVRFKTAGENLALAPTLQIAHNGLMNSPGHRANILRPQFGRVGIGVLDGGRRGLMISQEFRD